MTHHCTACSSEFDDDSGPLPDSTSIHCVYCGARIPLAAEQARTSVVPFSRDYEREEAFALGVISGTGPGFPDTLRQFRVHAPSSDSLTPIADGSEAPNAPPAPPRFGSLTLSLAIGFGVGVGLAFAVVSLRTAEEQAQAAAPVVSRPNPPASSESESTAAPSPAAVAASAPAATAPPTRVVTSTVSAAHPASSPAQDRRWWLDRARAEQRQYRLSDAERMYRQVLALAPHDSEALTGLGELELLRGTVDLAEAHFQQAVSANANYVPALVAAADIRWQSGRTDEARQAYLDILDHFSADAYPPYVALRAAPTTPALCDHQAPTCPSSVPSGDPPPKVE